MELKKGAAVVDLLKSGIVADFRSPDQIGEDELKVWLLVRRDLELSAGKLAGQSGHAFFALGMQAVTSGSLGALERYLNTGQAKIVVGVKSVDQLNACVALAEERGIPAVRVVDAGRTELNPGTLTVAAIGPCRRSELPGKIRRLKIYQNVERTADE
ncbi:aminoacyl-tRNA hydrolase [Roseibium sp. RKSG952]|uniref:aminoacyl-tRNA hydrolase n=1 Tax=Roseibium sp. RKSG952 TaxID=2529384 RepID=UPI0018AD27D0|nr:aminoacyl-tRNA hydrolase [Roseibium sp. RKSG952]